MSPQQHSHEKKTPQWYRYLQKKLQLMRQLNQALSQSKRNLLQLRKLLRRFNQRWWPNLSLLCRKRRRRKQERQKVKLTRQRKTMQCLHHLR